MTAAISSRRDLLETAPARRGPPRSLHCHRKPRASVAPDQRHQPQAGSLPEGQFPAAGQRPGPGAA